MSDRKGSTVLRPKAPFDLPLSLRAGSSFIGASAPSVLRIATRMDRKPVVIEVRQTRKDPPVLEVLYPPETSERAPWVASYVLHLDLDLTPFYRIASRDTRLAPIVKELWGLRPLRPASLFEMLVTAITEQQISMRLAHSMREKMTGRFGDTVDGTPVFPDERALASASPTALLRCGLSHRKAEYIRDLSRMVFEGRLDLERLKGMSDESAYNALTQIRGIGPWSAEYVLVRGLGHVDRVPIEDLGIRKVVGRYLGKGERLKDPGEVLPLLQPFAPFKGLAAYYLLVHDRLDRARKAG